VETVFALSKPMKAAAEARRMIRVFPKVRSVERVRGEI
jgi:hypothetical protein